VKYPGQESSILEFKRELPENNQIVKTIIGFCNQHGGKLIVGIDDDGTIVGIPEEKLQAVQEYLDQLIYDSTTPPIIPKVYTQRFGEQAVLIVEVSEGMNKPYFKTSEQLSKGTYIRLGRSTLRAGATIIEELQWHSRGLEYDMMPVHRASPDDLDMIRIKNFLEKRKSSRRGSTIGSIDDALNAYHLVAKEHGKEYPTVCGLLLFGKNPDHFFSEARIMATHFFGTEGREAIASINCTGTLIEQYYTVYDFILSRLHRSFSIKGPTRIEKLEIPEVAIREALINAIVHRNYHHPAPTKVAIYQDRIEFFSPGEFPSPLNTKNLTMGLTYIRNHAICKIFFELGIIETMGSGFLTIFKEYETMHLKTPIVVEGENFIKCILPRE